MLARFLPPLPHRLGEVVLGHLEVVLRSDRLGVPDPLADNLDRELVGKFRLPRAAKVLEQLGLGLHSGSPDDPQQLRSQVRSRFPVSSDNIFEPWFGQIEALFQVRPNSSGNRGATRDSPPKCPGI